MRERPGDQAKILVDLMRGFGFAFDLSLGPSQNPAQLFKDPAQLFNHKSIIS